MLLPADRLAGRVPVEIAGCGKVLRFTMESLAALEEIDDGRSFVHILWAMLIHEDRSIAPEDLEDAIDPYQSADLFAAVRLCMELSSAKFDKPANVDPQKKADWPRLWSYAHYELGLQGDAFWGLTQKQFAALSDRHEEAYVVSLHGSAKLCALYAEAHRDEKKRPEAFSPADFLPDLKREREKKTKPVADVGEKVKNLFACMGARQVKATPVNVLEKMAHA